MDNRKYTTNYSLEQWNSALNLRKGGKSPREISIITGIPNYTIQGWIYRNSKPFSFVKHGPNPKEIPESAKNLTKELAYIIGVINGDGWLIRPQHSRAVCLKAKDLDFVSEFKRCLTAQFKLPITIRRYASNLNGISCQPLWGVQLFSVKVYDVLDDFDLNCILNVSEEIKAAFIRGFADSEATTYKNRIRFYNTSLEFLSFVQLVLQSMGISSRISTRKRSRTQLGQKTCYELNITHKNNLKPFYEKIGFTIKRKNRWNGWKNF